MAKSHRLPLAELLLLPSPVFHAVFHRFFRRWYASQYSYLTPTTGDLKRLTELVRLALTLIEPLILDQQHLLSASVLSDLPDKLNDQYERVMNSLNSLRPDVHDFPEVIALIALVSDVQKYQTDSNLEVRSHHDLENALREIQVDRKAYNEVLQDMQLIEESFNLEIKAGRQGVTLPRRLWTTCAQPSSFSEGEAKLLSDSAWIIGRSSFDGTEDTTHQQELAAYEIELTDLNRILAERDRALERAQVQLGALETNLISHKTALDEQSAARFQAFSEKMVAEELLVLMEEKNQILEGNLSRANHRLDLTVPQNLDWYLKRYSCPQALWQFLSLFILFLAIGFALCAISEIQTRQSLDVWLHREIERYRDQVFTKTDSPKDGPSKIAMVDQLKQVRDDLNVLSLTGAIDANQTVSRLSGELRKNPSAAFTAPAISSVSSILDWINPFNYLAFRSSDFLLSGIVLFSGTIGAVIASMRQKEPLGLREVGLGMAAGFITFLAIRGGKSVFLMNPDSMLMVNPYNSAFFGILAGLFTELAYGLLRDIAEQIVAKLRDAFVTKSELKPPQEIAKKTQALQEKGHIGLSQSAGAAPEITTVPAAEPTDKS